jgi:hypothetical protein
MYPGDINFEDKPDIRIMAHEMSHGLDFMALQQYGSPFSDTSIWRDNYNQDSAVPTDYSHTNFVEEFAEVGTVGIYDKVVPGGIGNILGDNWKKIFHQYATYQGYLGDNIIPGGTCRNRVGNSAPVSMTGKKRGLGPKPDVSFKNSTINVVEIDESMIGFTITHSTDHMH